MTTFHVIMWAIFRPKVQYFMFYVMDAPLQNATYNRCSMHPVEKPCALQGAASKSLSVQSKIWNSQERMDFGQWNFIYVEMNECWCIREQWIMHCERNQNRFFQETFQACLLLAAFLWTEPTLKSILALADVGACRASVSGVPSRPICRQ